MVGWFRSRIAGVAFLASFLILTIYWDLILRARYFPSGDEFALIVSSTRMFHPSFSSWFLQGYSRFFISYPGLAQPATDFVRPAANAVYFVNSMIFGTHWAWYLLFSYAVQAGLVYFSLKLALYVIRTSAWVAAAIGLLVFLSPAFGLQQMVFPSFAFDPFGALCVLWGLYELSLRRYLPAWLLFTVAVFTKETALFAPVLTALLVWLPRQRSATIRRKSCETLVWMLPVLSWVVVRRFAFHGHSGIYVFAGTGLRGHAADVIHGVLSWPFGTRTLRQSVRYRYLFFAVNALVWGFVVWVCTRHRAIFREGAQEEFADSGVSAPRVRVYLLVYGAGALALPLLLNQPERFGAGFFPLFYLFLASLSTAGVPEVRRWAAACVALASVMSVYRRVIEPNTLEDFRGRWSLAESYIRAIHDSKASELILLDDASGGFTSPDLVSRFAGFQGHLIRVSNLDELPRSRCEGEPEIREAVAGSRLEMTSLLRPDCGFYRLNGVSADAVQGLAERTYASQGLSIRYSLPPARPAPVSGSPEMFGEIRIVVDTPGPVPALLYPDLGRLSYVEVPSSGRAGR